MLSLAKVFSLALVVALVSVATCSNSESSCSLKPYLIVLRSRFDELYQRHRSLYRFYLRKLQFNQGFHSSAVEIFLTSSESSGRCDSHPYVSNYTSHKFGYRAIMNTRAAETTKSMSSVKFVEEEQMYYATYHGLPWHLDRIDQKLPTLDGRYEPTYTGSSVDIYIIDSGIRYSHQEFGGRAHYGGFDPYDGDGLDRMGHGTHVAALAAGSSVGAARANLYSVRVFDNGSAPTSTIVDAIYHVIIRVLFQTPGRKAVMNMSLGGSNSFILDFALYIADLFGIVTVAAAGNDDFADACNLFPASSPFAITVGATNRLNKPASFTNVGPCVDIFAPGKDINSASHTADTAYTVKRGTSMAAPLVAGAVAILLTEDPTLARIEVKCELVSRSTVYALYFNTLPLPMMYRTVNRLLYIS